MLLIKSSNVFFLVMEKSMQSLKGENGKWDIEMPSLVKLL